MKPLPTTQRVFKWFCVYSDDGNTNEWENAAHLTFTITIGILELCAISTSAAFIVEFLSTDFESPLFGLLQVLGHIVGLYGLLFTLASKRKIAAIFERLLEIYNESMYSIMPIAHVAYIILNKVVPK